MLLARMAMICSIVGCASANPPLGPGDDDDVPADASTPVDARQVNGDAPITPVDAAPMIDAFVFLDAAPDAPSALFCSANNQCTNAGECCIRLGGPQGFCGPGIPIGSECLPQ
jgi:hypothetical protein